MIPAKHTIFHTYFFKYYTEWILKQNFHDVIIRGDTYKRDKPIFLIGNHFSWYDGFFALYCNNKCFNKRFYVMMLEEQLKSRIFLRNGGAFGIKKGSRDIIEGLQYTRLLLQNPHNIVAFFPQGQFASLYHYPVTFEPGLVKVLEPFSSASIDIIFMVALVDFFAHKKPTLTLNLKYYQLSHTWNKTEIEKDYNTFLKDCISKQNPNKF